MCNLRMTLRLCSIFVTKLWKSIGYIQLVFTFFLSISLLQGTWFLYIPFLFLRAFLNVDKTYILQTRANFILKCEPILKLDKTHIWQARVNFLWKCEEKTYFPVLKSLPWNASEPRPNKVIKERGSF